MLSEIMQLGRALVCSQTWVACAETNSGATPATQWTIDSNLTQKYVDIAQKYTQLTEKIHQHYQNSRPKLRMNTPKYTKHTQTYPRITIIFNRKSYLPRVNPKLTQNAAKRLAKTGGWRRAKRGAPLFYWWGLFAAFCVNFGVTLGR